VSTKSLAFLERDLASSLATFLKPFDPGDTLLPTGCELATLCLLRAAASGEVLDLSTMAAPTMMEELVVEVGVKAVTDWTSEAGVIVLLMGDKVFC